MLPIFYSSKDLLNHSSSQIFYLQMQNQIKNVLDINHIKYIEIDNLSDVSQYGENYFLIINIFQIICLYFMDMPNLKILLGKRYILIIGENPDDKTNTFQGWAENKSNKLNFMEGNLLHTIIKNSLICTYQTDKLKNLLKNIKNENQIYFFPIDGYREKYVITTQNIQDIDVLFYGEKNKRRQDFLNAISKLKIKLVILEDIFDLDKLKELINRSKIVIHFNSMDNCYHIPYAKMAKLLSNNKILLIEETEELLTSEFSKYVQIFKLKNNEYITKINDILKNYSFYTKKMDIINPHDIMKSKYNFDKNVLTLIDNASNISLDKNKSNDSEWPEKIPKILHLYWHGNQFTIFHYLTIKSFLFFNKDWKINIYTPQTQANGIPTWSSHAQKYNYTGINYFPYLKELNVNYVVIDFESIGFFNDASDVHKSDYLRWYLLYQYGGVWSDFDILYIKKLNNDIFRSPRNNCDLNDIEVGIYHYKDPKNNGNVFPIGLLFAAKNHNFYKTCLENAIINFDRDKYQCMGPAMLTKLFKSDIEVLQKYINISILVNETIYPYKWNEIKQFFINTDSKVSLQQMLKMLKDNIYGIHWYNGCEFGKKFCSEPIQINNPSIVCRLLKRMEIMQLKDLPNNCGNYNLVRLHNISNEILDFPTKDLELQTQQCLENNYSGFNLNNTYTSVNKINLQQRIDFINKYNGCYVNNKIYPKISIVCAYHNRKSQMITTFNTIEKSMYKNIEVIIVDDASDDIERLEDIVDSYHFIIKIIRIEKNEKTSLNSCIPYNKGFDNSTGDIIIIQNPEVCHINDIISYVASNVTDENYISFSCATCSSFAMNEQLDNFLHTNKYTNINCANLIRLISPKPHKNAMPFWYNHPTIAPHYYHFCCAMTRKNLYRIRGFTNEYQYGYCYDDIDLVMKIKYDLKLTMILVPPIKYLAIHQYHLPSKAVNCTSESNDNPIKILFQKNKTYYEKKLAQKEKLMKSAADKIPKIFNYYVGSENLTYIYYMMIRSFIYYNPTWKVNIYVNQNHKNNNYWNTLLSLPFVNKIIIDFNEIGFYNDASNIHKLNFLKWHTLSTIGGIWSDPDIFYINSIENMILKSDPDFNTLLFNFNNIYPMAFFMGTANNEFFIKMKQLFLENYKNNKNTCINPISVNYSDKNKIVAEFPKLKFFFGDKNIYLPFEWHELDKIYCTNCTKELHDKTIGIYWFSETENGKLLQKNINDKSFAKGTFTILLNKFSFILENDTLTKDIILLN